MLASATGRTRASLGRVLDNLGTTLLDVVAGDPDRVDGIGGVVIHDPIDEPSFPDRALVLGVGVGAHGPDTSTEISELLDRLATLGAAGLVLRAPVEVDDVVRGAVERTGVVLLSLTRGASWNQLAALLRAMLAEGDIGADGPESLGGVTSGDLFALANAISSLLQAPVTIEDRSSRVLAFSNDQDEADQSRIATVLGRQVPDRFTRILEQRGIFAAMNRSERPVYVDLRDLGQPELEMARMAIAVRAGDEILGSIWAAVHERLPAEREAAMVDAAKLVALHLLRMRAGADVERRLRTDLVATALEGGPGAGEAAARLGLSRQDTLVLAMCLPDVEVDAGALSLARREAERQRSTDALALHLSAVHPGSVVALVGGVAYAILPVGHHHDDAEDWATRLASEFLERTRDRVPGMIGIGRMVTEVGGLARSRTDADRVLRVLRNGRTTRRIARVADIHIEALLLELGDLAEAEGHAPSGAVAKLVQYDVDHRTQLVETLRAWLDAFGDVIAAAGAVHVHPNTFRYRLRRISEVGVLDLDDSEARFGAMLQLRLLGAGRLR